MLLSSPRAPDFSRWITDRRGCLTRQKDGRLHTMHQNTQKKIESNIDDENENEDEEEEEEDDDDDDGDEDFSFHH